MLNKNKLVEIKLGIDILQRVKAAAQTLCAIMIGLSLTACSNSPTPNYYTLSSTVQPLARSQVKLIEVMPIGLPDRLDRSPMVIQHASGESKILDNQRWTSSLATEMRDALSAGLQQRLGAVDRYNSGMLGGKVSYRVATEFSRFDIVERPNRSATDIDVNVAWMIKRVDPLVSATETTNRQNAATQQLNCRMAFSLAVPQQSKNPADFAITSRQALNQVVDGMSSTIIALDSQTKTNIAPTIKCN